MAATIGLKGGSGTTGSIQINGTDRLTIDTAGVVTATAISSTSVSGTTVSANSVVLSGSTSGSLTLVAPAVAGTNTLTLAAATGNITPLISDTAKTATGTAVDFTGIPSWAKRISILVSGISVSGTSVIQVQVGSGSFVSTGYLGSSSDGPTLNGTAYTTGFAIRAGTAAATVHGILVISNISSTNWVASGNFGRSDGGVFISTGGSISLGGVLDRIRITTVNGTDTFDAGTINIMYE